MTTKLKQTITTVGSLSLIRMNEMKLEVSVIDEVFIEIE